MVLDGGISLPEAARRLSLPPSMSGNRVRAHKAGRLGDTGKTQRPLTDIEMEPARAKKAPVEAGMARNLLNQQVEAFSPNIAWVSDITYIPTDEGRLYLAGHKDLFNRGLL